MEIEGESDIGIVVIGRNEGERLRSCLSSLQESHCEVVYVDSGSTDNSIELAKSFGCTIVKLDMSRPFSAARARNAGVESLCQMGNKFDFVQFLDGDCEMDSKWLIKARKFLTENPSTAIVCGNRYERFPEKTVYNKLCAMEWQGEAGATTACGGDSLVRLIAFQQVNGFDESFICGEEPELCFRLKARGWQVYRLDEPMTKHDADMTKLSQFLMRARRSGHAYAHNAVKHGRWLNRFRLRNVASILLFGAFIPLVSITLFFTIAPFYALLLLCIYPLTWLKMQMNKPRGRQPKDHMIYSAFVIIGKFAQVLGVIELAINSYRKRQTLLIEYK
ncbi:glycosyltransferase family 2 protein [Microbulbifer sp. SA54]|uniref:glycosyltransferase family 2 protein n=1 Tax=Microbulbifer sp. SA54 TaxID=3401577 RepID=UPI003AAAECBD